MDSDEDWRVRLLRVSFLICDGLFEVWDSRILQSVHSTAGFSRFISAMSWQLSHSFLEASGVDPPFCEDSAIHLFVGVR